VVPCLSTPSPTVADNTKTYMGHGTRDCRCRPWLGRRARSPSFRTILGSASQAASSPLLGELASSLVDLFFKGWSPSGIVLHCLPAAGHCRTMARECRASIGLHRKIIEDCRKFQLHCLPRFRWRRRIPLHWHTISAKYRTVSSHCLPMGGQCRAACEGNPQRLRGAPRQWRTGSRRWRSTTHPPGSAPARAGLLSGDCAVVQGDCASKLRGGAGVPRHFAA